MALSDRNPSGAAVHAYPRYVKYGSPQVSPAGRVDQVRTAVQHLIKLVDDGALTDLGASSLVGFLQDWETVRNTMPVIDQAAIQ